MTKPNASANIGRWILFGISIVPTLFGYLLGALSLLFFMARKPKFIEHGVLILEWREWFATGCDNKGAFRYSTTLVRTVWYNPCRRDDKENFDDRVEQHERVHIFQAEDAAFQGFVMGAVLSSVFYIWGFVTPAHSMGIWFTIYVAWPLALMLHWPAALLRYGPRGTGPWHKRMFETAYRDSLIERHAYAETDLWSGEMYANWLEKHDKLRDS